MWKTELTSAQIFFIGCGGQRSQRMPWAEPRHINFTPWTYRAAWSVACLFRNKNTFLVPSIGLKKCLCMLLMIHTCPVALVHLLTRRNLNMCYHTEHYTLMFQYKFDLIISNDIYAHRLKWAPPCFIQAFGWSDEVLYGDKLWWNFLQFLQLLFQTLSQHLFPSRVHFLLLFWLSSWITQIKPLC